MITLDEKDIIETPTEISEEEDLQNKIESLRRAITVGEIPDDLKDFIASMQQSSASDDIIDEELDETVDISEQPYEVEINEMAADKDDDSFLNDASVSVEELNSLF